jgi:hypothetical protein
MHRHCFFGAKIGGPAAGTKQPDIRVHGKKVDYEGILERGSATPAVDEINPYIVSIVF